MQLEKFPPAQKTLLIRRMAALRVALRLIERELQAELPTGGEAAR